MKFAYFAYFYRVKYFKNIMNQRGNCSIKMEKEVWVLSGIIFCLLLICICFLIGSIYTFLKYQRPGVYPPKKILKQRIVFLGSGGIISLL
ncbi:hypothetical protein B5V90_17130, partial [Heyndrickxia sporothermodurans]